MTSDSKSFFSVSRAAIFLFRISVPFHHLLPFFGDPRLPAPHIFPPPLVRANGLLEWRNSISIDHQQLLDIAQEYIADQRVLDLLKAYLQRTVYDDGIYRDVRRGILLGCALSPLMGALYLKTLDDRVEVTGLFYARFMDDWVILAPTRWKLRAAIRVVNQTLNELKVEQHPYKTFIGRISRGFDFLGYRFSPAGLQLAPTTITRFRERVAWLYEQGADDKRIKELDA